MNFLAHITIKDGKRVDQSLKEHCMQTARYASRSLKGTGFYHMAYLAGILHDMGKATKKYNDYLNDAFRGENVIRGSVNHTFAGVIYVLEKFHKETASPYQKLTAEVISYAIGAHHGLFDCVNLDGENGFIHRLKKDRDELCYEEARSNFFSNIIEEEDILSFFKKSVEEFNTFYDDSFNHYKSLGDREAIKDKIFFMISMLSRLLLSAVIYGDRRDTSEFMNQLLYPELDILPWQAEKNFFEERLKQFKGKSQLNKVRKEISDQCFKFADYPKGIYRLNVPTGGGKTLCSLRYALAHADKYQKKRVIFVIPLLSILDQNVKVIRKYIKNKQSILEHHSNVIHEKEVTEELDRYEILTENWEAPIIVTTLVQILDILFSNKTSQIGRMRALCDSIIIFDEVQSIPQKTIAMFNMAVNFLNTYCNATIVLSSATQPCFDELKWSVNFSTQPDMVYLNKQQLSVFDRTNVIDKTDPYGMNLDNCVDFCLTAIENYSSLLVICNTKKEARELFKKIEECNKEKSWLIYHLSTSMCQKHRMEILEKLQKELDISHKEFHNKVDGRKIICISTQLVEAGVDFSFQCVVRVLAGIDNLAQAAGRCNRSNEYGNKGDVYLINLQNENLNMLKEIKEAQKSTQAVLVNKESLGAESLIGQSASQLYYKNLFRGKEIQIRMKYPIHDYGEEKYLMDLLGNKKIYVKKNDKSFILHQPFKTISKKFQVFDNETIDILVPFKEGETLIQKLKEEQNNPYYYSILQEIAKKIKLYTVSIYQWQKEKLWEAGLLYGIFDDRILILDKKAYDEKYGVDVDVEQDVSDYIL